MTLGVVIYSTDAETVWNAFRLANFALKEQDKVKIFLLAKGVECQALSSETFDIEEQMKTYLEQGGEILACGTCLNLRNMEGTEMCPMSSMKDLYELIKGCDKTISF